MSRALARCCRRRIRYGRDNRTLLGSCSLLRAGRPPPANYSSQTGPYSLEPGRRCSGGEAGIRAVESTADRKGYCAPRFNGPGNSSMSGSACLKIGVFGGTFDPVHIGHLVVATEALAALRLDKVQFVLAGTPPHKPGQIVSSNEHRSAMLELAIAGRPGFELSDADLRREGPSYSADLLRAFRAEHPQDELYFIIGARCGNRAANRRQ